MTLTTRYIPPTDNRGARILVTPGGFIPFKHVGKLRKQFASFDHAAKCPHEAAAMAYAKAHGLPKAWFVEIARRDGKVFFCDAQSVRWSE